MEIDQNKTWPLTLVHHGETRQQFWVERGTDFAEIGKLALTGLNLYVFGSFACAFV